MQRRATKLLPSIKNLSYKERLLRLGLPSLEYRRQRANMIQVYKILQRFDQPSNNQLLRLSACTKTRGNNLKLYKRQSKSQKWKFSFGIRVVEPWNNLPNSVVIPLLHKYSY